MLDVYKEASTLKLAQISTSEKSESDLFSQTINDKPEVLGLESQV